MKYKALITDFDGTLVDDKVHLPPGLKASIDRLGESGFKVIIATGRAYLGAVKGICQELSLSDPQIVLDGTEIIDPKVETILWSEHIPQLTSKELVDYLIKSGFSFRGEVGNFGYFNNMPVPQDSSGLVLEDIREMPNYDLAKILVYLDREEEVLLLEDKLRTKYSNLRFFRSSHNSPIKYLTILSSKASKKAAIEVLGKLLDLKSEELVGAGNSYNDYPLLMATKFKVTTYTSPQELKDIADMLIPPPDERGLLPLFSKLLEGNI
jgi:Cof subfamily protein (haloacid dehalogenase superfamily)